VPASAGDPPLTGESLVSSSAPPRPVLRACYPRTVKPREETIAVGPTRVHTLIGGQGDPLLILHGAGGNRGWRRWMTPLSAHYTIYAPTHPGFGRSDAADWMQSIDDLARFYLWFLDVAGLSKLCVVGHSMGGWTAAEMATMAPRAFRRLVLVAPTGLKPDQGEILDIFYHPPAELLRYTVHDPATVSEWTELFGRPPRPTSWRSRSATGR
jgi:pimeloyl-ACP methyl ester carboxylesterase